MDGYVLVMTYLFILSGVQAFSGSMLVSRNGNLRSPRTRDNRSPERHHRHQHPMICCDSQTEVSQVEEETNEKVFLECKKNVSENRGPEDVNSTVCLMSCVMEELKLMEYNGRIKKKALDIIMNHHNDVINEKDRKKIEEVCYDERAGPLDGKWSTKCNKEPYNLVACAHQMKEVLCPLDKQFDDRHCDEYREEMKKMYGF